jgi:hypothetical protein
MVGARDGVGDGDVPLGRSLSTSFDRAWVIDLTVSPDNDAEAGQARG